MKEASQEFARRYTTALESYLTGAGEVALSSAYELGRQALEYESGILIVAAAHHKALHQTLLPLTLAEDRARIISEATNFFSECLSPFEMAQRGFQESIASLHSMNEALSRQQRELSLLLSPMPNLLLTIDERNCLAAFFVPPGFPHILKGYDVGMPLGEVLPDEMNDTIRETLPNVRRSGQIERLECSLAVNRKTFYFDLQVTPIIDARDILLVIDNITERKEIQIAEQKQRLLAEALRDTASTLNSSLDLNEILDRIVNIIRHVVPHDTANIMLIDNNAARVVRSFGYVEHGLSELESANLKIPLSPTGTPALYQAVESKQFIVVSEITSDHQQYRISGLGRSGSFVSVPMLIADSVIGLINLNSFEPDFFTTGDAENLQIFASQAAVAIQNAQLFEQAQEVAAFNERQRLARDLHDSVSQSLFAASSIAESVFSVWERNPQNVFPLIVDLRHLIKSIMAEMRILLGELRPASLVNTPLDKLFMQLTTAVQSRTEITVHCVVEGVHELPEDVHLALYRITQESLNNIVKHSQATEASIRLYPDAEQLILRIRDNGRGFSKTTNSPGLGLGNMRERAQLIGASLEVASDRGQGTEVMVTWMPAVLNKE